MGVTTAYIALGGNVGEVQSCFIQARIELHALPDTQVTASSLLYRTPAHGPVEQADYLNAALEIKTALQPLALLDALQNVENYHGRLRDEHWGPRTLDLDILAMDSLLLNAERLQLPHPHLQNRQFMLRPLCDIAPNWQHPRSGKSTAIILQDLLTTGEAPLEKGIKW
jgi:2-amino-4-hydroxy-6-hydroxymethyldihydropteridine diphosphokinase